MSDIAIRCEGLSKRYRIGRGPQYKALRESLGSLLQYPFRLAHSLLRGGNGSSRDPEEIFWALQDVSFEVKTGDVLGVIGRNGAGKSTLLRILSRITEPTRGTAEIHGRVGSLLEVGTGFHAELTGRENVFLNGAILGMRKAEIKKKFDEIVAFAEIEKFVETPVKHYSSGMYVRLAFAVAAHLNPEILLIDEVLAVGDLAFQRKCLEKMDDVARCGRTILFVSHNLAAISNLCNKAIMLEKGRLLMAGDVAAVTSAYLESGIDLRAEAVAPPGMHTYGNDVHLLRARILDCDGIARAHLGAHQGAVLEIEYDVFKPISDMIVFFRLQNKDRLCVLMSTDVDQKPEAIYDCRNPGRYVARCSISPAYLRPGRYFVDIECGIPSVCWMDRWPEAIAFEVFDTGTVESKIHHRRDGVIAPILPWDTQAYPQSTDH